LYTFVTQESSHVKLLVDFFRAQEAFLEQSLQVVRKAIPDLLTVIECNKPLTVFHKHLPDHLTESNRFISYVLERCITRLDHESTLQEEKALNLMEADDELLDACDTMTITGALKQYLNSLPEPLITFTMAERWSEALKGYAIFLSLFCSVLSLDYICVVSGINCALCFCLPQTPERFAIFSASSTWSLTHYSIL
uniref:Rho-GAP domain-containing protein n=1 Tax=Echinostoma caproni TaxID=27848 RepID=A0A183AQI9_9TREM